MYSLKPVYSNNFFAAENGKKKTMKTNTKWDFLHIKRS